jgi:hypothetical protein
MLPKKRKNEAVAAPSDPKKVKTGHVLTHHPPQDATSAHGNVETNKTVRADSKALKAPTADEDFEWEILDGDKRETLLKNVAAPNRLRLRFRHRHNDKEQVRIFQYKKPANEIDWNSKQDINDINKWRNQVFTGTMKFPPKVTHTTWAPFETAYIELFHEKLKHAAAADGDATFVMPHNNKILEAFNGYFGGRGDIQDKKGDVLEPLGARPAGSFTSYLTRKGTKIRELRESLKEHKRSNGADAYMPTITDAEIKAYLGKDGVTEDNPAATFIAPGRRSSRKNTSNVLEKVTKASQPKGTSRWVKPAETKVIPDSTQVLAASKAAGWNWSDIPITNEEAVVLHRAAKVVNPVDNTWNHQAIVDLDKRIHKYEDEEFNHEFFNRDLLPKYDKKNGRLYVEDWHEVSAREEGAAAVTGLLNTADIPPFGYTGDIHDLVTNRQLPPDEFVLAESREDALQKKIALIYRRYNPRANQPVQKDIADDSDSTGDESIDD